MKVKLVAYKKENGTCLSVFECKNVDEKEYNQMINEEYVNKQKEIEKWELVYKKLEELEQQNELLKKEIKFLKGEDENEESN